MKPACPVSDQGRGCFSLRCGAAAPAVLMFALALGAPGCRSPLDAGPGVASQGYRDWVEGDLAGWRHRELSEVKHRAASELGGHGQGEGVLPNDVEAWVAIALERHPGLRAAELRVIRLRERGSQVSSLDDPDLRVVPIGEQSETAAGRVRVQTRLSQALPFPGKLDAKAAIAVRDAAVAEMRHAELRLEVAASVRRAFWGWRYARRATAVMRRDEELLGQFLQIAEAKYRAGTAEQQDVLRAQVELAGIEKQLLVLRQQGQVSAAMLNRLLDRGIDASLPVFEEAVESADGSAHGSADFLAIDLAMDSDLERLLDAAAHHPKLAGLRELAARYREEHRLANLNRYPDLTVSLNYAEVSGDGLAPGANGDDQWSVGFGINLPLWQGKRDAAEREALAGIYETAATLADEQNRLVFEVRDALARVQANRQTLALFQEQMLPDAEQAVAAAGSSYRAGNTDFLTLIDNWRRLTGLRLTYEQVYTQLQKDLADLRLATAWTSESENNFLVERMTR